MKERLLVLLFALGCAEETSMLLPPEPSCPLQSELVQETFLGLSANGRFVASLHDGSARVLDRCTRDESILPTQSPTPIPISDDGSRLAFVNGDGRTSFARVLDMQGELVHEVEGSWPLALSQDGERLAYLAPCAEHTSQCPAIAVSGSAPVVLAPRPEGVSTFATSRDLARVVFLAGSSLRLWEPATGSERALLENTTPGDFQLRGDGAELLVHDWVLLGDGRVTPGLMALDLDRGNLSPPILEPGAFLYSFSADESLRFIAIVTIGSDVSPGETVLFDRSSSASVMLRTLIPGGSFELPWGATSSADGTWLAAQVHDPEDPAPRLALVGNPFLAD